MTGVALTAAALIVVAIIATLAVGRSGALPPVPRGELPEELTRPGELQPHDLHSIRFAVGVRGYRMDQVDALLDRLAREMATRQTAPAPGSGHDRPAGDGPGRPDGREVPQAGT